jgi:hypothetical protein
MKFSVSFRTAGLSLVPVISMDSSTMRPLSSIIADISTTFRTPRIGGGIRSRTGVGGRSAIWSGSSRYSATRDSHEIGFS